MSIAKFLTEENLQRLLNQQLEEDQGVASLLPSNVSPFFRMDATGGVRPSTELIRYYPEQDLGATYDVPLLESDSLTIQNPGAPQSLGFDTSFGIANEEDEEDEEQNEGNRLLSGLASLRDFLPGGDKSVLGMLRNALNFRDSPMYRPAGAGVFGYTPAQLNQMNALGGFYSEPMREMRRRSNRISNMLQRAAADKSYSEKNLQNLMNQFGMDDTNVGGMIESIRESSDMGYGRGGGRDFDSGRDYSSSPGAIAGDMEYGEE
jgi:hypothetical protein